MTQEPKIFQVLNSHTQTHIYKHIWTNTPTNMHTQTLRLSFRINYQSLRSQPVYWGIKSLHGCWRRRVRELMSEVVHIKPEVTYIISFHVLLPGTWPCDNLTERLVWAMCFGYVARRKRQMNWWITGRSLPQLFSCCQIPIIFSFLPQLERIYPQLESHPVIATAQNLISLSNVQSFLLVTNVIIGVHVDY